MHLDVVDQIDLSIVILTKSLFSPILTLNVTQIHPMKQNKENNKEQIKEKIGVTEVHTIGDCELRSLLIIQVSRS